MFDDVRWSRLTSGESCPLCSELLIPANEEPRLVANWPSTRVIMQNDAAFRGYCILVSRRHVTEITDLDADERRMLFDDVTRVASAIQTECRPRKLNYAILGNEVPHLHVHIIPRYPDDGWWGKAIWLRPADQKIALPADEYEALRSAIRNHLA